jgi:hypothetical protein
MGYRSDVTYAIVFRDMECKRKFVALNKLHPQYHKALEECLGIDDEELTISAVFESVKWYDSFSDVQCHMKMLESIVDDKLDGVSAKFARAGEEGDDVEEMHFQGSDAPSAIEIGIGTYVSSNVFNNYI